jgi:hypothetical protein
MSTVSTVPDENAAEAAVVDNASIMIASLTMLVLSFFL